MNFKVSQYLKQLLYACSTITVDNVIFISIFIPKKLRQMDVQRNYFTTYYNIMGLVHITQTSSFCK